MKDFGGLSKRSAFLAFAMLISMISLAGVPFIAGFLAKFMIFDAAIANHQTTLVVVGIVTVACGFYYYLKVVRAMYWEPARNIDNIRVGALSRGVMTLMMVAIVVLGVYPQPILRAIAPTRSDVVEAGAR